MRGVDVALADDEAVRIQMCEYLCLVAYQEAIDLVANERLEDGCLFHASGMRARLTEYIVELHQKYGFT